MRAFMNDVRPALTEDELRYWLANEDWYMSRHTRDWLDRTPPERAADVLARIAEDARPEPRSPWLLFLMIFAATGFSPSNAVAGKGPDARRAGVRAALMLADLNDERAVAPLARTFEPHGLWQNKYQEQIEAALTKFLSGVAEKDDASRPHAAEVADLARRAWQAGGPRRDLTPALADLVIASLRYLRGSRDEAAQGSVREILESSGRARGANRERALDVARSLVDAA